MKQIVSDFKNKIAQINSEKYEELNGRGIISVTKLADFIAEPFDKVKQAENCALKGKNDPLSKYAGMTAEEIIQQWEDKAAESRMYGDLLDEYTEQYLECSDEEMEIWKMDHNFDSDVRLKNNCTGFEQFYADITSYGFIYAGREITVYGECNEQTEMQMPFDEESTEKNLVVGRIDCLFVNPTVGKFLIVDWKTTDDIKITSFKGRKMKGPANQYLDCDLSKYIIQVQTYKNDLIKYGIAGPADISVCICNLRKEPEPNGKYYRLYKENTEFNPRTLDDIVNFSVKKRRLLKKLDGNAPSSSDK